MAPAAMPDALVARLSAELIRIIRLPEVRAQLTAQGAEVVTMTPPETNRFFASERTRWAAVVRKVASAGLSGRAAGRDLAGEDSASRAFPGTGSPASPAA